MSSGNLKYQFARLGITEKLIALNVVVYIVNSLLPFLFQLDSDIFMRWFELPKDFFDFITQPWSLITYSFFHGGIWHLFWNMVILYVFGRIFLDLYGPGKFINVYFLGVIFGGLLFLLSYNVFPALIGFKAALIGASAGVTAVLIFVCAYTPNREIRLLFFNVKLWYIGAFFVLADLIQIPSGNAGGHLAHLGGAILGYVYARQLTKGKDIGTGFTRFREGLSELFKKKERRKSPLKTVHRRKTKATTDVNYDKAARQRKIDTILDKISKSGYESLSKAEKDFLFKAGKED
ncbi:MAG: rhomboid family intramembrane serine protease [Flavobacteriaceae bacterium]